MSTDVKVHLKVKLQCWTQNQQNINIRGQFHGFSVVKTSTMFSRRWLVRIFLRRHETFRLRWITRLNISFVSRQTSRRRTTNISSNIFSLCSSQKQSVFPKMSNCPFNTRRTVCSLGEFVHHSWIRGDQHATDRPSDLYSMFLLDI